MNDYTRHSTNMTLPCNAYQSSNSIIPSQNLESLNLFLDIEVVSHLDDGYCSYNGTTYHIISDHSSI